MRKTRKLLSLLLVFALVMSMFPVGVFAMEVDDGDTAVIAEGYEDLGNGEELAYGGEEEPAYGYEEEPGYGYNEEPGYGYEEEPADGDGEEPVYGDEEEPEYGYEEEPGYGYDEEPEYGYEIEPTDGYIGIMPLSIDPFTAIIRAPTARPTGDYAGGHAGVDGATWLWTFNVNRNSAPSGGGDNLIIFNGWDGAPSWQPTAFSYDFGMIRDAQWMLVEYTGAGVMQPIIRMQWADAPGHMFPVLTGPGWKVYDLSHPVFRGDHWGVMIFEVANNSNPGVTLNHLSFFGEWPASPTMTITPANPTPFILAYSATQQFNVSFSHPFLMEQVTSWTSDVPLTAGISATGLVTPVVGQTGDVTITASTTNFSATRNLRVIVPPVPRPMPDFTNFAGSIVPDVGIHTDFHLSGIPGGIPTVNFNPPIYITLEEGATADDINYAIQAAGDAVEAAGGASPTNLYVVQLGKGIFDVGHTNIAINRSGVILRGMGNDTIIRGRTVSSGVVIIGERIWTTPPYPAQPSTSRRMTFEGVTPFGLAEPAITGDSSITLTTAAHGFTPGMILILDRMADDAPQALGGSEWLFGPDGTGRHTQSMRGAVRGDFGPASGDPPGGASSRPVRQYIEVESVNGATLNLVNRINIDFPLIGSLERDLNPQVFNAFSHENQFIGLESVKIQATAGYGDPGPWSWNLSAIHFGVASSYSWVKHVVSDGTFFSADGQGFMGRHVEMNGFRNHVTSSSFQFSAQLHPGGNGYGIRYGGTDSVIENNIANMLNKPIIGMTTGGGNVIAYNYVPNAVIVWAPSAPNLAASPGNPQTIQYNGGANESAINVSHGGYAHSDLFEGNWTANFHTDGTSGNGWFTFFRNHSFGQNITPSATNRSGTRSGIQVASANGVHISIGNVFLNEANAVGASVWSVGGAVGRQVYRFDTGHRGSGMTNMEAAQWSRDNFYNHLDFNYIDYDILEDPNNPFTTLPDSMFLSAAPWYFTDAGMAWPPINPFGTTHAARVGDIPAVARFENRLYTVTFSGNGTDFFATVPVLLPATTMGTNMPDEPEKEGYVFDGWNSLPDGTGTDFEYDTVLVFPPAPLGDEPNSPGPHRTLYAQWIAAYNVTVNDGTASHTAAPENTVVILTADTAPAGYVFVNWTSNDVTITNPTQATGASFTMPANDVTVTANFAVAVVLTPPTVTIGDAALSASSVVSGAAEGAISINTSALPAGVTASVSGNTITVTGVRPAAGQANITGSFVIPVTRGGFTVNLTVTVNLTTPRPQATHTPETTPRPQATPTPAPTATPPQATPVRRVITVPEQETALERTEYIVVEVDDVLRIIFPPAVIEYLTEDGTEVENLYLDILVHPPVTGEEAPPETPFELSVEFSITRADEAVAITEVEDPIKFELNLSKFEIELMGLDGFNPDRVIALLPDGTLVRGVLDEANEVITFTFATTAIGNFSVIYAENLRIIGLEIGSYDIMDLIPDRLLLVTEDMTPIIQENRALVPIRFVAYVLGARPYWNPETREVTLIRGEEILTFAIGELAPGMDVPAQIMNNRTMVPLRFVAEFFNVTVTWEPDGQGIEIIWRQ